MDFSGRMPIIHVEEEFVELDRASLFLPPAATSASSPPDRDGLSSHPTGSTLGTDDDSYHALRRASSGRSSSGRSSGRSGSHRGHNPRSPFDSLPPMSPSGQPTSPMMTSPGHSSMRSRSRNSEPPPPSPGTLRRTYALSNNEFREASRGFSRQGSASKDSRKSKSANGGFSSHRSRTESSRKRSEGHGRGHNSSESRLSGDGGRSSKKDKGKDFR